MSLWSAASGQGVQGLEGGEQTSLTARPPTQGGAPPPQRRVLPGTHLETHTHTGCPNTVTLVVMEHKQRYFFLI